MNDNNASGLYNGLDPIAARRRKLAINGIFDEVGDNPWWGRRDLYRNLFDDPRRDLDFECGYPPTTAWSADSYYDLYEREALATRAVQLMPKECWQLAPIIKDGKKAKKKSDFENAVDSLDTDLRGGWHKQPEGGVVNEMLYRGDELSGIGSFGILLLGFDDGKNLEQPVDGMIDVLSYRQAATQNAALRKRNPNDWHGLPDSPLHPTTENELLNHKSRKVFDGYHPATLPSGEKHPQAGSIKYKEVLPLPFTANEKRIIIEWRNERQVTTFNAALNLSSGLAVNELGWNERLVAEEGFVTNSVLDNARANVQNARRKNKNDPGYVSKADPHELAGKDPLGSSGDPMWGDGVGTAVRMSRSDPSVSGIGYGSGYDPSGFDQPRAEDIFSKSQQVSSIPSADALVPDTTGKNVGSMGGTEQQYFGVQLGPSEMPKGTQPDKTERAGGKQEGQGAQAGPTKKRRLLFVRAYAENLVQVVRYEWNSRNPRFGMPVMYRVTLNDPREVHSGVGLPLATVFVHWTRVIHLAKNLNSSEIFGVPVLRPILNPLLDARKVRASSAEAYWRNCVQRISWETNPQLGGDVKIDRDEFADMMSDTDDGLRRYYLTSGLHANTIAPSLSDPTNPYNVAQQTICTQLGVPLRIWQGAERGQLASSQDDENWNDRVTHHCNSYLTPRVVCPFYDRLIAVGVLPMPENHYTVEWPDRESVSDRDKAAIAQQMASTLQQYINGSLESMITPKDFWVRMCRFSEDEADEIIKNSIKDNEGAYNIEWQTIKAAGGMTGMVNLFEALKNGTISEGAFKRIVMIFYDMDEDQADEMVKDALAKPKKSDDEVSDLLGDKNAAAVALQKTQAMAAYLKGGLDELLDKADYMAEFIGVDPDKAQEMIDKAKETKQQAEEEKQANQPPSGTSSAQGTQTPGIAPPGGGSNQPPAGKAAPPQGAVQQPPAGGPSQQLATHERKGIWRRLGEALGVIKPVRNSFCPTGEGGGVDPSCSPGESASDYQRLQEGTLSEKEHLHNKTIKAAKNYVVMDTRLHGDNFHVERRPNSQAFNGDLHNEAENIANDMLGMQTFKTYYPNDGTTNVWGHGTVALHVTTRTIKGQEVTYIQGGDSVRRVKLSGQDSEQSLREKIAKAMRIKLKSQNECNHDFGWDGVCVKCGTKWSK